MFKKRKSNLLIISLLLGLVVGGLVSGRLYLRGRGGQSLGVRTDQKGNFIAGGIVPHHLLAGELIEDFFKRLGQQEIRTLILVGPNHLEEGDFPVLTGLVDWQTEFGVLGPDQSLIQQLVVLELARIDDQVLQNEHSVSGLVPFVKKHLPDSLILPLVLSNYLSLEEIEKLAAELGEMIDEKTVVVAAVDFSHYLTVEDAQANDQKTLALIKSFDYPQILNLGNDYLDSPSSVALLLKTMGDLGKGKIEVLDHANSIDLAGGKPTETTSYFSIVFY